MTRNTAVGFAGVTRVVLLLILAACGYALTGWGFYLWSVLEQGGGAEPLSAALWRLIPAVATTVLFAFIYGRGNWGERQATRLMGGFLLLLIGFGTVAHLVAPMSDRPSRGSALVAAPLALLCGIVVLWRVVRNARPESGTASMQSDTAPLPQRAHRYTREQRFGHIALAIAGGVIVALVRHGLSV